MPRELEFLLQFKEELAQQTGFKELEAFLAIPIKVVKGQEVAREVPVGRHASRPTYQLPSDMEPEDVAGPNVVIGSQDDTTDGSPPQVRLFSRIDGYIASDGEVIIVTPHPEIYFDIGPLTGDLSFAAPVRVQGGVLSGYSLACRSNIEILGLMEGGTVRSEASIMLRGGMAGGDSGLASAAKNVLATFVQQGTIEARDSIMIEGMALDSYLSASRKIIIKGRASLVGGVASAGQEISAPVVGSEGGAVTEIRLGIDPFISREKEDRLERRKKIAEQMNERRKEVRFATQRLRNELQISGEDTLSQLFHLSDMIRAGETDSLDEQQTELFHGLERALLSLVALETSVSDMQNDDSASVGMIAGASLKVSRIVHPCVKIGIADLTLNLDREYERVRFIMQNDEIVATAY